MVEEVKEDLTEFKKVSDPQRAFRDYSKIQLLGRRCRTMSIEAATMFRKKWIF